jgi:hypothetical protein
MMRIILGIALGMVGVAPFLGKWRAKIWLRKHVLADRQITRLPRPELHEPNV